MSRTVRECCVCREHYDAHEKRWYSPSIKERRDNFMEGVKYTHGFCEPCYILNCKLWGIDPNEPIELPTLHIKHDDKSKTK